VTYIPTICVVLFILLFIYCSFLYPGSSQHDINSEGFSWQHNYWCDIMDIQTYDQRDNPARIWGIIATLILCIGTGWLFYQFPSQFGTTNTEKWLVSGFGIASMLVGSLIFTSLHNQVIGITSGLALVAILTMFYVLFRQQEWPLFYYGVFACVVMLANNHIYYSKNGIEHLPWIQKISFLIVLAWIVMIDMKRGE